MEDGSFRRIEKHTRTGPAHDPADSLTFLGGIAVDRTVLTRAFLLTEMAMVETAAGIVDEMGVLLRDGIGLEMAAAIEFNHLSHNLLTLFYLAILHLQFIFSKTKIAIKSRKEAGGEQLLTSGCIFKRQRT